MEFYNVRKRKKVKISHDKIERRLMESKTKNVEHNKDKLPSTGSSSQEMDFKPRRSDRIRNKNKID